VGDGLGGGGLGGGGLGGGGLGGGGLGGDGGGDETPDPASHSTASPMGEVGFPEQIPAISSLIPNNSGPSVRDSVDLDWFCMLSDIAPPIGTESELNLATALPPTSLSAPRNI
jgi:hypothetical protein